MLLIYSKLLFHLCFSFCKGSVRVAEWLALPTSVHGVAGSNPTVGEILPEPKRRFIAQSLSCSPFHRLEMSEILLKGRKTLTHPSILFAKAHGVDQSPVQFCLCLLLNFFVCMAACYSFYTPAKQSFRGYTVFSMSVIPSFHQHLRVLLYNFDGQGVV